MGLLQRISDIREDNILDHARPHIEGSDQVLGWVRVRRARGPRGAGFLYLTNTRIILHWVLGKNHTEVVEIDDIKTWRINSNAKIGPIVGVETTDVTYFLQVPTMTQLTAEHASAFLKDFAGRVPSNGVLSEIHGLGEFGMPAEFHVLKRRKSVVGMTRRIIVTVVGVLMIAFAILIIPVPGPWSLLLNLAGLALLGSEYDWAQDILGWVKKKYAGIKKKVASRKDA